MAGLGTGVLYLVLIALELTVPGAELQIDYLQDGVPTAVIGVEELPSSDRDLYLVRAVFPATSGTSEGELIYRIEQSDLVSTNYLVYGPTAAVPVVASLVPALTAFPSVVPPGDYELALDPALAGEGVAGIDTGTRLVVLPRPPYLVLSAPEAGVVLIVEPRE
jgi:hypothetical protein